MDQIHVTINGEVCACAVRPGDRLLDVLRREGYFSVKFGDEHGQSGASTVIVDGALVNSAAMLAAQADGAEITTAEALGVAGDLHPLQQAFIDTGAVQCGYCTPAQLLAAKWLLDRHPNPTGDEVREALAGVLCRCTGYVRPVAAVLRAAAIMRGDTVPPVEAAVERAVPAPPDLFKPDAPPGDAPADMPAGDGGPGVMTQAPPKLAQFAVPETTVVGKPEPKVDAAKLAMGKPVFTDDVEMRGMLYGALLTSPHAHARIVDIDVDAARTLPGVHAVLTHKDVPRVIYATGGQSWPNPPPWDQVSLDNKVRHVGDRVAIVAAETPEIAAEALKLIKVEYEVLPAALTIEEARAEGAPVIHDEPDAVDIHDAQRNIAAHNEAVLGDEAAAWAETDKIVEGEYRVHQVQQASIEPHVCITYWDEDDRLVVRTSTQVPFHARRMLAPLIGLPVKRIRVIKPRIGGGFGGKQEVLLEDLCAHLTLATGRPVRMEYSRELMFTSARSRHTQIVRFKTGVKRDGTITGMEMIVWGDTGAYGTHGLTVQTVSGLRGLSTYNSPYRKFVTDVHYTNRPVAGAYRGYGAPQAEFALEVHMEQVAERLGMDVLEFKAKNWVKVGDGLPMSKALGEAREGFAQVVTSSALAECVELGAKAIGWQEKRGNPQWRGSGPVRRGIGVAIAMHGTAIAGLDMGGASIKINDDGSFNLLVGATDLGTGSDTILGQIAAEMLGVPLEDIIVYSSDTDMTPFDTGAYASSTTYISGGAVKKAAERVREQILERAGMMLEADPAALTLADRKITAPNGRSITLEDVALHALHTEDQMQIMAAASHMSYDSPPPFAAQFAEVSVDTETGQVTVHKLVMAVDCGVAINPVTAAGQVEGGMTQALGWAVSEEMAYDEAGRIVNPRFGPYRIFTADEMPELQTILVESYEPSGPYGAKAVAEIPKDGVAPAIASAIRDATGAWINALPFTPERVWRALREVQ
jgi:putative selenate reductase molybdopterin-binding subunit